MSKFVFLDDVYGNSSGPSQQQIVSPQISGVAQSFTSLPPQQQAQAIMSQNHSQLQFQQAPPYSSYQEPQAQKYMPANLQYPSIQQQPTHPSQNPPTPQRFMQIPPRMQQHLENGPTNLNLPSSMINNLNDSSPFMPPAFLQQQQQQLQNQQSQQQSESRPQMSPSGLGSSQNLLNENKYLKQLLGNLTMQLKAVQQKMQTNESSTQNSYQTKFLIMIVLFVVALLFLVCLARKNLKK